MAVKAGYPVVRKFTIDSDGTSDIYVDIGECLSLMNHRLYRQGKLYRCRVSITSPVSSQGVAVTTLPDTWWARTAYNKVRDLWMRRIGQIKSVQGDNSVGRWNDFKVGYDGTHRSAFTSTKKPELVTDATGTQAAMTLGNAEWALSVLGDNDGNDTTFRMLSTSTTSNVFNVIQAYGNITNVFSPDPEDTGTGAGAYGDYDPAAGEGDTAMDDFGDYPPYHETDFPQMEVLQAQLVSIYGLGAAETAAGISRLSSGYFDAPLGLLRITPAASAEITIEVQAGDYKGVHGLAWE